MSETSLLVPLKELLCNKLSRRSATLFALAIVAAAFSVSACSRSKSGKKEVPVASEPPSNVVEEGTPVPPPPAEVLAIAPVEDVTMNEDADSISVAVTISRTESRASCSEVLSAFADDRSLIGEKGFLATGQLPNCSITTAPLPNQHGTTTVNLTAQVGSQKAAAQFTMNVLPQNDIPTVMMQMTSTVNLPEENPVILDLATGVDPDVATSGQTLSYFLISPPSHGVVSEFPENASAGGTIVYSPQSNFVGLDQIKYQICDTHSPVVCSAPVIISLNILNINDPPTDIALSSASVFENEGSNVVVGSLTAADPDAGDKFNFALVSGDGDADNNVFEIDGDTLRLTDAADFEVKSSYSVRIQARDQDGTGLTFAKAFTITVANLNEAPIDIDLTGDALPENAGVNAVVGSLSTEDPDSGDDFIYTLVSGSGSADNAEFNISGNSLIFKASADFETKNSYSVLLRSSDSEGEFVEKPFIISITDLPEWEPEAYIKAAQADPADWFGWGVSLSGDALAVGVAGEDGNSGIIVNGTTVNSNNNAEDSGAVYVYRRSGSDWTREAFIKPVNTSTFQMFGFSLSLSGDTLAVGAPYESSDSTVIINGTTAPSDMDAPGSGAVYVYRRIDNNWAQEAYIKAPNAEEDDFFSECAVTLSGDTLAIGARNEDENSSVIVNGAAPPNNNGSSGSGAVYVYRRTGSSWAYEAYIKAANNAENLAGQWCGLMPALSGDTLAVGAPYESGNSSTIVNGASAPTATGASESGAVYVYRRTGSTWYQEAYIKAVTAQAGDRFGTSISLSGDTLAVGAPYEDAGSTTIINGSTAISDDIASDSGAVYIYRRTGTTWAQESYIKASNGEASDHFGFSASLAGDSLAVVGWYEDEDSTTIVNGPSAPNENGALESGAVYVYRRIGSSWAQEAYIKAANSGPYDYFGDLGVSISGDTLAVGAWGEDENSTVIINGTTAPNSDGAADSGAVYVYRNTSRVFDPDVRVSAQTPTSITFAWNNNHGAGTSVVVSPAVTGTASSPPCTHQSAVTLSQGVTSYTYSGLTPGTKYGFRFCSTDGGAISNGFSIWADSIPNAQ